LGGSLGAVSEFVGFDFVYGASVRVVRRSKRPGVEHMAMSGRDWGSVTVADGAAVAECPPHPHRQASARRSFVAPRDVAAGLLTAWAHRQPGSEPEELLQTLGVRKPVEDE